MKTELKLELTELAGLTPKSINEHYERMLNRWKFNNSDEVWIDGRLIDLDEKILIGMGMYNIKPKPKEIIVSELKAGFKITEQLFIESMIRKLNSFVNIDKPEDVWQMRVNLFLKFLKERQSKFYVDVFDFMADVARLRYCDVIHGYHERIKLFAEVDRKEVLEFSNSTRTAILKQIFDSDFHHSADWKLPIGDDFGNPDSKEILNDRIQQLSLSVGVSAKYKVFDISLLPKNIFSYTNWQFDFDLLQRSNDIINLVANIGYVNFLSIEIEKCNDFIQQIESKKHPAPQTTDELDVKNKDNFNTLPDSGYPTIKDDSVYDPEKIYIKFNPEVFKCSKFAFYAWLVHGKKYEKETITWKHPINAQLKLFIDAITNSTNAKEAYFKAVFGVPLKASDYKNSHSLKIDLSSVKK